VDASFLAAVAAALGFASALITYRMRASGASGRRIAILIAELWAAFALWIAAFVSLSGLRRTWAAGMLTMSIIVVAHLLWSLRQAMRGEISG
jgi:hypothetical protein